MPEQFEFVFLRPWWLLLIPLGFFLAYGITRPNTQSWRQICDAELLSRLMVGESGKSTFFVRALAFLGWTLAALALAGPAWDKEETVLYENVEATVVVFDLSRSMESIDLQPTRLERARYKAIEVIERNEDRAIGLVVFAGSAFDVTPVSDDVATVIHLLQSVEVSMMPIQGSRASEGLIRGRQLLENSGYKTGSILLLTDGVDKAAEKEAEHARRKGYKVSVIGVGSTSGGPIQWGEGEFLRDDKGEFVLAPVDLNALADVASAGGGSFSLVSTEDDQALWLNSTMGDDQYQLDENVQATTSNWKDRGPLLLIALLPLVALLFRRGWLFAAACVLIVHPNQSQALEWADLWKRSDQRARLAIENQVFDDPSLSENPQWNGIANYRLRNYEEAGIEFSQQDDRIGLYNHANSLAKLGDLLGAIEKYEAAIEIDPDFEDAVFNLGLIRNLLEEQEMQGDQGSDQGEQQGSQRDDQSQNESLEGVSPNGRESEEQGLRREGDVGQNSGRRSMGEERSDQENREMSETGLEDNILLQSELDEELSQVMEQWMRQIPDDPGGLLRRKFYYESLTREYEPMTSSQPW